MEYFGLILFVFLQLLTWLIFIRIIFSWIAIIGINIEISFISRIVDPMFEGVAKYLPVRFIGIDLSPLIILLAIRIIETLLLTFFPEIEFFIHTFI